jgi:rhodanese-related sulfurtransferase
VRQHTTPCVCTYLTRHELGAIFTCVPPHIIREGTTAMTTLITRTELEEAISTNSVVLVDALPASYYDQAHLPGAINLVEGDVEALAPKLLPNKDAAIVTYCSNVACNNSQAVANRLEKLGYTNVRKYREGIQDWDQAGNKVEQTATA